MPNPGKFKDFSVTFKKHPVTDDIVTVKDKAAITQSIKGLLLTKRGERPFQPRLGSGLHEVLFEPLDYASSANIKAGIQNCLLAYEPRIQVQKIRTFVDYDNNGYNVELEYSIVGRRDSAVAVEFFLSRTR